MQRTGGLAAIVVLAAVGLSACGGQAQPSATDTAGDCAAVKTIDANLAPVQQDLRSSVLAGGNPAQITKQQVADYRKMSTIVSDGAQQISDSARRDKAQQLAQTYTTIAGAIAGQPAPDGSGSQAQDLLGKLGAATAAVHSGCEQAAPTS
ncbi:hypothetical protein G4X40_10195 [Rhodococcus sp. D2-41]|uniref:Uncharacterized protein n=1 Tax=Speluncibacter jeojiensis TaxID=2710754 RepID=A0A9X4LXN5_9ACTN|nr:hypothetical protein [Rhodococcus sp. D2-41]MDG3010517.1 hypothetical protein [Rhodococcus sp. D2-41]MDG3014265.1 hypothetical protein [Corynebacteriales bacterium D3-21]